MSSDSPLSRRLVAVGFIAMLIGAIDPMEGSVVILFGGGLILLGTYLGHAERRLLAYRTWVFILLTAGVAALVVATMLGGVGGDSGYSIWWALIFLPYPIGWFMGILGPGSPKWVLWLGNLIGLFYLLLPVLLIILKDTAQRENLGFTGAVISLIGALIITGCTLRLRKRSVL